MNNLRTIIIIVIIFILAVSGIYWFYQTQVAKRRQEGFLPIPTVEPIPAQESVSSPSPALGTARLRSVDTGAPAVQPEAGSSTVEIKNAGIQIISPLDGIKINSPLKISGQANILGDIVLQIKDSNGNILGEGKTTACIGYDACPFTAIVDFEPATTQTGIVSVYNESTTDHNLNYIQSIPIKFN